MTSAENGTYIMYTIDKSRGKYILRQWKRDIFTVQEKC